MKPKHPRITSLTRKCMSILASNWQGELNSIKADTKGSKEAICSAKVKYFVNKGEPYLWIPKNDYVKTIVGGSFAVTSPYPGPLVNLLQSVEKSMMQNMAQEVVLRGEIVPIEDEEVEFVVKSLEDSISAERKAVEAFICPVSSTLNSSTIGCAPRSANHQRLVDLYEEYNICRFNPSSCKFYNGRGVEFTIDLMGLKASMADPLSPFSACLIDGINQSEMRLRALKAICSTVLVEDVLDAFVLHVDVTGVDILAHVLSPRMEDSSRNLVWAQYRLKFKGRVDGVESFCRELVELEIESLEILMLYGSWYYDK